MQHLVTFATEISHRVSQMLFDPGFLVYCRTLLKARHSLIDLQVAAHALILGDHSSSCQCQRFFPCSPKMISCCLSRSRKRRTKGCRPGSTTHSLTDDFSPEAGQVRFRQFGSPTYPQIWNGSKLSTTASSRQCWELLVPKGLVTSLIGPAWESFLLSWISASLVRLLPLF
ncbi:hypothetical protein BJX70DRAFT_347604 [Aspergillus crustosus]